MDYLLYWQPNAHVLISLVAALIPALVGSYAWQRRGRPGAAALAILMWLFAIWGFLYLAELGMQSTEAVDALYEVRSAVFLGVAPL